MIRTDSLDSLDPSGRRVFDSIGAGLVLDLRSDWEITEPHPLDGAPAYRRFPWIDPAAEAERDADSEPFLADIYRGSLDRNQPQIVSALRAVADAPVDAPVVVHCRSGKDRTGLLAALLLELVGVSRDVIAADYAVSEQRIGLADGPALMRTVPATILDSLDHLDRRYGGVRAYLAACGLTAAEIHRLAARLVSTPVEAVVFDFDGLLMDTETTMVESWRAAWRHHGLELDLEGFWPGHGGDISEARYERLASLVLGEARELGLPVAIASSSPRDWVVGHLRRVDAVELFDLVVTGDEVATHKPDPAIYLLALSRLGLPGEAALAVEDTPHGVAAAAAAGMSAIAIPNPYVPAEAVAHADLVLGSADQILLSEALFCSSLERVDLRKLMT